MSIDRKRTCSFSGHRKIPGGMSDYLFGRVKDGVNYFYSKGVRTFLAGGAIGFDTLSAKAVIECREILTDIQHEQYEAEE